jgi:hypothetical protein
MAMHANTSGHYNIAVGYRSLESNTGGSYNVAVGFGSLLANTVGGANVAVGDASLASNTTAELNVAVGRNALSSQFFDNGGATWSSLNTAVGADALLNNAPSSTSNGRENTAIGAASLPYNTTGSANTAVGVNSMYLNETGSWNVAVGMEALYDNVSGTGNIAIGHTAGSGHTGSDQLFIGNGLGTVIWGDMNAKRVAINATSATNTLDVNGTVRVRSLNSGSTTICRDGNNVLSDCSSDARLKRDVRDLTTDIDVLEALERLRGVTFNWDTGQKRARGLSDGRQIGMIAQEVEPVLPELVSTNAEGMRSLDYSKLTAFLIEVAKTQQGEIEAQRRLLDEQQATIAELSRRLGALEATRPE